MDTTMRHARDTMLAPSMPAAMTVAGSAHVQGGLRVSLFTLHPVAYAMPNSANTGCACPDTPMERLCTRFSLLCIALHGLQIEVRARNTCRECLERAQAWLCSLYTLLIGADVYRLVGRVSGRRVRAPRCVGRAYARSPHAPPRVGRAPPG